MSSKHRMPEPAQRIAPARHRPAAPSNVVIGTVAAAVASAGVLAGVLVQLTTGQEPATAPQASPPASVAPDRPLSQQGIIIALTSDSVTARSVDGFTQTYRITPDTTTLPEPGALPTAAPPFAINDEVEIVGAVRDGTAVATAVADRTRTNLNGPPMHFVSM